MSARLILWTTMLAFAWAPSPAKGQGPAKPTPTQERLTPVGFITVKSYDSLREVADYVTRLGGKPEAVGAIDSLVSRFTAGKGLEGVDTKRPIGLFYMSNGGADALPLIFVPVKDREKFLQTFKTVAPSIFPMVGPQPHKLDGRWFFIGPAVQHISGAMPNPDRLVGGVARRYQVAFTGKVSALPQAYHRQIFRAIDEHLELASIRRAGESAEHYQGRQVGGRIGRHAFELILNDAEEVTVGFHVSPAARTLGMDFVMKAKHGSELAVLLGSFSRASSRFASLVDPSSPASLSASFPLTGRNRDRVLAMFSGLEDEARMNQDVFGSESGDDDSGDGTPEALVRLLATFKKTLEAGMIDGAVTLRGSSGRVSVVGGCHLVDGREMEELVREIEAAEKEKGNEAGFEFDVAKHRGVRIHAVRQEFDDPDVKAFFGAGAGLHVGFGQKSVFFAFGADSLRSLTWAVDKVQTGRRVGARATPFALQVRLRPLLKLLDEKDPDIARALKTLKSGGNLRAAIESVANGLRLRFEVDEALVRFLADMAASGKVR